MATSPDQLHLQKPQTNKSAYNSYSWGANWGPDPLLPVVPSSERASQRGNYGNSIKERKECGAIPLLHTPAAHPTPQLHVCPIPIPSHPVVCIVRFVISLPHPTPFLFAFKIMKLCSGPCLSFTSSCSPWWCVDEVGRHPPNIYQPNGPKSSPLLLGKPNNTQKMAS